MRRGCKCLDRNNLNPSPPSDQYVQVMAGERLAAILPTGTGNAYFTTNV